MHAAQALMHAVIDNLESILLGGRARGDPKIWVATNVRVVLARCSDLRLHAPGTAFGERIGDARLLSVTSGTVSAVATTLVDTFKSGHIYLPLSSPNRRQRARQLVQLPLGSWSTTSFQRPSTLLHLSCPDQARPRFSYCTWTRFDHRYDIEDHLSSLVDNVLPSLWFDEKKLMEGHPSD